MFQTMCFNLFISYFGYYFKIKFQERNIVLTIKFVNYNLKLDIFSFRKVQKESDL